MIKPAIALMTALLLPQLSEGAPGQPFDTPPVYHQKVVTVASGAFEVVDGAKVHLEIGDLEADNFLCALRVFKACGVQYNANASAAESLVYQQCLADRGLRVTLTVRSESEVIRRTVGIVDHPELDFDPKTESVLGLSYLINDFMLEFKGGVMNERIGREKDVTVDLAFELNDNQQDPIMLQFWMIAREPEFHGP